MLLWLLLLLLLIKLLFLELFLGERALTGLVALVTDLRAAVAVGGRGVAAPSCGSYRSQAVAWVTAAAAVTGGGCQTGGGRGAAGGGHRRGLGHLSERGKLT